MLSVLIVFCCVEFLFCVLHVSCIFLSTSFMLMKFSYMIMLKIFSEPLTWFFFYSFILFSLRYDLFIVFWLLCAKGILDLVLSLTDVLIFSVFNIRKFLLHLLYAVGKTCLWDSFKSSSVFIYQFTSVWFSSITPFLLSFLMRFLHFNHLFAFQRFH